MVMSFVTSPLSDWLMNKGYISTGAGRKIFNTIAYWGPGLALIGLGYAKSTELAVTLLTVALGLNAGTYLGYMVNHMDLAPVFAGTLMGITNGIANILSILGPLFVGIIVDDEVILLKFKISTVFSGRFFFCCCYQCRLTPICGGLYFL